MEARENTLPAPLQDRADGKAAATLILVPQDERLDRVEAPLFSCEDGTFISPNINYAQGCVRQNGRYNLVIEFPQDSCPAYYEAALYVNGSEEMAYIPDFSQGTCNGNSLFLRPADQATLPFGLVCGHARIRVELYGYTGSLKASFYSSGILCEQEHPINNRAVEEMIDALMGDPAHDKALEWMTRCGSPADNEPYSLLEGGYQQGAARSVPTYLAIVEAGLDSAEAALPYIRGHAAGRISHVEDVLESNKVRHLGAREASWIAMHPEVLRPAVGSKCPISYRGRRYTPSKVSSLRTFRNLDVYENRLCLSFLFTIAADLADFESKLAEDLASFNPACAGRGNADMGKILLVALARALQSRHKVYANKANSLKERAFRLLRAYQRALPNVETRPLNEMRLVRTKIFKEVRAYSQIYPAIERFAFFGESLLHADGLSIATLRLDRVYETYALYRMLSWLADNGFAPNGENPVFAGRYGYTSEVFSDAPHVSNVYHLKRGRTRVSLFYEPVCFASAKEENGITLHRMRAGRHGHAEFTPDYVLMVEHDSLNAKTSRQVFILDAKYRSRWMLTNHPTDKTTGMAKPNVFETSANKYMLNTIDAATGRIPDGMWLLSGKQDNDPEIIPINAVPWDSVREPAYRSGIALLTPETELDQLFRELGIPALGMIWTEKASGEPAEQPVRDDIACIDAEKTVFEDDQAREERGGRKDGETHMEQEAHDDGARILAEQIAAEEAARKEEEKRQEARKKEKEREKQEKKEKQLQREEKHRMNKEKKAKAAKDSKQKNAAPADKQRADEIARMVLELLQILTNGTDGMLYNARKCRLEAGSDKPILRKQAAKDYRSLPGKADIFYYCPKVPTYANLLRRYIEKLKASQNRE